MLQVNGIDLNHTDKNNPYIKFYNKCLKELKDVVGGKKDDFSVTLVYSDDHKIKDIYGNTQSVAQQVTPSLSQDIIRDGVRERWTYYIDTRINEKGVKIYLPKRMPIKYSKTFTGNNADWELAFFLIFISPTCELAEGLKHLQNQSSSKSKLIKINNIVTEERARRNINLKKAQVMTCIYDLEEEVLRDVAEKDFNMIASDHIPMETIANNLVSRIIGDEYLLNNFNIEHYNQEVIKLRRLFNFLYDKNLVGYDRTTEDWRLKTDKGVWGDKIVAAPKSLYKTIEDQKEVLIKELIANKNVVQQLIMLREKHLAIAGIGTENSQKFKA